MGVRILAHRDIDAGGAKGEDVVKAGLGIGNDVALGRRVVPTLGVAQIRAAAVDLSGLQGTEAEFASIGDAIREGEALRPHAHKIGDAVVVQVERAAVAGLEGADIDLLVPAEIIAGGEGDNVRGFGGRPRRKGLWTHDNAGRAKPVELPQSTKRRLGLDDERSSVILSEANRFIWPGPGLRPARRGNTASVAHGQLPYTLFETIRQRFISAIPTRRAGIVPRSE